MKKTLFPLSFGQLILYAISTFYAGLGIYMLIRGFRLLLVDRQIQAVILIIFGLGITILFLYVLAYLLHNRVVLTDNKIIVTGHWIINNDGLQFPDEVKYEELEDVAIICANANSKKKRIKKAGFSSLRPFVYYEIKLKNKETKWIYIECFSQKQRKQILAAINEKSGLNLSYEQLEQKDYSIYKKAKQ